MASRTFSKPIAKADKSKRTYDGVVYDSVIESRRAHELDLLVRGLQLSHWLRQVPIRLGKDTVTRIDFLVFTAQHYSATIATNEPMYVSGYDVWAEEVKHECFNTREFRRIRKLWAKYGPFRLKILWWTGSTWKIEWLERGTETEHGV